MNYDDHIEEGHASAVCGLCEVPVEAEEPHKVVVAHGQKHLVHAECVSDLREKIADERDED